MENNHLQCDPMVNKASDQEEEDTHKNDDCQMMSDSHNEETSASNQLVPVKRGRPKKGKRGRPKIISNSLDEDNNLNQSERPKRGRPKDSKGQKTMAPLVSSRRGQIRAATKYQHTATRWSQAEKKKLLQALEIHSIGNFESLSRIVTTRSPADVEEFIKKLKKSIQMSASNESEEEYPIMDWICLVRDLMESEEHDYSACLGQVMSIVSQFEDQPTPSAHVPDYKLIYLYLAKLLNGEEAPTLGSLEAAVLLDLMHDLVEQLLTHDTSEQAQVMKMKFEMLTMPTDDLHSPQELVKTARNALRNDFKEFQQEYKNGGHEVDVDPAQRSQSVACSASGEEVKGESAQETMEYATSQGTVGTTSVSSSSSSSSSDSVSTATVYAATSSSNPNMSASLSTSVSLSLSSAISSTTASSSSTSTQCNGGNKSISNNEDPPTRDSELPKDTDNDRTKDPDLPEKPALLSFNPLFVPLNLMNWTQQPFGIKTSKHIVHRAIEHKKNAHFKPSQKIDSTTVLRMNDPLEIKNEIEESKDGEN